MHVDLQGEKIIIFFSFGRLVWPEEIWTGHLFLDEKIRWGKAVYFFCIFSGELTLLKSNV